MSLNATPKAIMCQVSCRSYHLRLLQLLFLPPSLLAWPLLMPVLGSPPPTPLHAPLHTHLDSPPTASWPSICAFLDSAFPNVNHPSPLPSSPSLTLFPTNCQFLYFSPETEIPNIQSLQIMKLGILHFVFNTADLI